MKIRTLVVLVLLSLPMAIYAQEAALTPLEKLKVENVQLKLQLAEAAKRIAELERTQHELVLTQEVAALIAEIEAAHPGYTLRDGQLVPKPEEKKDP